MTRHLAYQNPIFPHDFADPFVLKYGGEYWAYCTGHQPDGRVFGVLHSRDLVHWQELGGGMPPLPGNHPCYWAPEVIYDNGRFYLYYSVGDETAMHIRVATSEEPAGPFVDEGVRLTQEPFAIDGHVYTSPDGRRYFFYATDFLDHERVGTGTVIDRMLDFHTLAGHPHPVSRARYDWQIYDPRREEKGGVRWHTLEGPFVLERKGIYYQMFSGGNWRNLSYGVSYATTKELDAADEWEQACDGDQILPILQTVAGRIIGPGHNSVVRGPDNRQLVCVYHRWGNGEGRQLAIDPLEWAGERLLVLGPSHAPQVGLPLPTITDFFDSHDADERRTRGDWRFTGVAFGRPERGERASLSYHTGGLPFVAEVSARAMSGGAGGYGLELSRDGKRIMRLCLSPSGSGDIDQQQLILPTGFRSDAFHLLHVEVDGRRVAIRIEAGHTVHRDLAEVPDMIELFTDGLPVAFAGFALTVGWQDEFDAASTRLGSAWSSDTAPGWAVQARELTYNGPGASLLQRGPYLPVYDLVVNARLLDDHSVYGIAPTLTADVPGTLLTVERVREGWAACYGVIGGREDARLVFPLPEGFDPFEHQQFRFLKEEDHLTVFWEQHAIANLPMTSAASAVGLFARGRAAFDMVRVSAVPFLSPIALPTSETIWKPTATSFGQLV